MWCWLRNRHCLLKVNDLLIVEAAFRSCFNGVLNLEKWSSAGRKYIHKIVMSRNQNMHFVLFVKWPSEVMKTGLCTLHCSVVQSLTFPDFHSKIPLFLLHIVSHFLIKLAYFRIFEIVWSLCMVCLHALNPRYNDVVQYKIVTILWKSQWPIYLYHKFKYVVLCFKYRRSILSWIDTIC